MPRAIIAKPAAGPSDTGTRGVPDGDAPPAVEADAYTDKLVKLIPAEVISLYLSMTWILSSATPDVHAYAPVVVFAFCAFATWFYMRYTLKVTDSRQLIVTVVAFLIWGFAAGEPYSELTWWQAGWWNETYSGLLLAGFTFLAPNIPMGEEG